MCVDYTYLNRPCLKDYFPFSKINQLEDLISYHGYLAGYLLEFSPNTHMGVISGAYSLHYTSNDVLVYGDVIWVKEC